MQLNEIAAGLIGAGIGALVGLAGAGFALLASIRASQLAARVVLAPKIHTLNTSVIALRVAIGKPSYNDGMKQFQIAWNDFIVHQKILAPSRRLTILGLIVRDAATDSAITPDQFVVIASEAMNAATDIIALYSEHAFRWRARWAERGPIRWFQSRAIASVTSQGLLHQAKRL
jgi:hypothetical protein